MTGTYAGQFVMEGFFDIELAVWKRVLVTRCIAILPALSVAFINNFDDADTYLNILQSVQLPFALIPLIKFTSSEKIMGEFAIHKGVTIFAAIMGVILFVMNWIGIIPGDSPWWVYLIISFVAGGYLFLMFLVIK